MSKLKEKLNGVTGSDSLTSDQVDEVVIILRETPLEEFLELTPEEKEILADVLVKLDQEKLIEVIYFFIDIYKQDVKEYLRNEKFKPTITVMKEKSNSTPPVPTSEETETEE